MNPAPVNCSPNMLPGAPATTLTVVDLLTVPDVSEAVYQPCRKPSSKSSNVLLGGGIGLGQEFGIAASAPIESAPLSAGLSIPPVPLAPPATSVPPLPPLPADATTTHCPLTS